MKPKNVFDIIHACALQILFASSKNNPPISSVIIRENSVFISNLVETDNKFFVFLKDTKRNVFEKEIQKNNLFTTGIGFMTPAIYFDTWTMLSSNKNKLSQYNTDNKNISSKIPIYVVYTDNPNIKEFNRTYLIETKTTIIISTMWETTFRIIYSVYSMFFSLIDFDHSDTEFLFLEYRNSFIDSYNEEKRTNIKNKDNWKKILFLFGSYNKLLSSEKNIVYLNVFFGIPKESLFLESEKMNIIESEKEEYEKRKKALEITKFIAFERTGIIKIKQKEAEDIFFVLVIKRKERKIQNVDEIINIVEEYKSILEKKKNKKLIIKEIDLEIVAPEKQIALLSKCDLLIALNGPELAHVVFMKKDSFVLEIIPYACKKTIYMNISKHTDIHYFNWQNNNIENAEDFNGSQLNLQKMEEQSLNKDEYIKNQNTKIDIQEIKKILEVIIFFDDYKQKNYLVYLPWEQFNNQLLAFKTACIIANKLNRTLVLPKSGYRNEKEAKRIQEESKKIHHGIKNETKTHEESIFKPEMFVWSDFEKYFDAESLEGLFCETIPFSSFLSLEMNIDTVTTDKFRQDSRYVPEQIYSYYKNIIGLKSIKLDIRTGQLEIDEKNITNEYNHAEEKQTLALGMLFDKIQFGEKKIYPLTKFYDYTKNENYKKINDTLKYHKKLHSVAKELVKKIRKNNEPFSLALHIRRADYAIKCFPLKQKNTKLYESCYQEKETIIRKIEEKIGLNAKEQNIYIATDTLEYKEIESSKLIQENNIVFFNDIIGDEKFNLDVIEISIVEQLVCAYADVFIGNYSSSYTRAIVELKKKNVEFW